MEGCWLEQMFLALCKSVLIMLYLLVMAWWLSHCKYWLVWVGFLQTVVSKLTQGQKNICSNQQLLEEEQTNIQKALTACKYPAWEINRMKLKIDAPKTRQNNRNNRTTYRSHITVPYNEGLSESIKNIGKRYGIQVHFKSGKTFKRWTGGSKR